MLGHEDPSITLKTYADLFDTDLDALADVLGTARTEALKPPTTTGADSEPETEKCPSTQKPRSG
jgi:hypothetical protein